MMIVLAASQTDTIEISDIIRHHIHDYQEKYPLLSDHRKVLYDLLNCRTQYLGGHVETCDHCGAKRITYNSCRNRHCPKCQTLPRERWINARKAELLPVSYFHSVFTLPHELNPIILFNKKIMLTILFKSVSETLLAFGHNPKNKLGGKIGFITILHTWDQQLNPHFHLHCLIPGGAAGEDMDKWIPCKNNYLFNKEALARVFRGKFVNDMTYAYENNELVLPGIISHFKKPEKFKELKDTLYSKKWVVYMKDPIKKPDYVLEYLGRYTHRVAISNHRIVSLKEGRVTFKYKNRKTNRMALVTVGAVEFIRRFLLHVLPKGFVRIRHYGFLTNRNKKITIAKIRQLIGQQDKIAVVETSISHIMLKLTGTDITLCPCCKKGKMKVVLEIPEKKCFCPGDIVLTDRYRKTG